MNVDNQNHDLDRVARSILTAWTETQSNDGTQTATQIVDDCVEHTLDEYPETWEEIEEAGGINEVRDHMTAILRNEWNVDNNENIPVTITHKTSTNRDLINILIREWKIGVFDYTYDADDPVMAADQLMVDRYDAVKPYLNRDVDWDVEWEISCLENKNFRQELINTIQDVIIKREKKRQIRSGGEASPF